MGPDAWDGPAFRMEPPDGQPPLDRLRDLPVWPIAAGNVDRGRLFGEDPPDRVEARPPPEADVADLGQLVRAERRVLGFELGDGAPHRRRHSPTRSGPDRCE